MAKRKKSGDDGPPGPAAWIVTFSDCMTLMLCFFVMLVSFSSFDEVSLTRLGGIVQSRGFESIFPNQRTIKDSVVQPTPRQIDRTIDGSEKPDTEDLNSVRNPREPVEIPEADAYRDKRVLYVPSSKLFWGNGASLTQDGRSYLDMISRFAAAVPCRVIVAEATADGGTSEDQAGAASGAERALSVVQYFITNRHLPADQFNVSGTRRVSPGRFGGQKVIEITLLARSVLK